MNAVASGIPVLERKIKPRPGALKFDYSLETEERLAAQHSGYTWADYCALPGTDRWLPASGGDSKASVLVFYRICKQMEALTYQELNDSQKPKK